ncbi:hypothetical protein ES703_108255 [subsurface metagenome]
MNTSNMALRFFPLPSGILKACIQSDCIHSNGEKNSNFRVFSASFCFLRFFLSRPTAMINLDNVELETVLVITPFL